MLTLQEIIEESELLVPNNTIDTAMNVLWLNHINRDFFNVVKIPEVEEFSSVKDQSAYVLNTNIREKNIDLVMIGITRYREVSEETRPLQNWYSFNDVSHTLTVYPAPYTDDLPGYVRYHQIATTTFTTGNLNARPDAPEEYHYLYVSALCAYRAKSQDDFGKAQVYENDWRTGLNAAAVNFREVDP